MLIEVEFLTLQTMNRYAKLALFFFPPTLEAQRS